MDFIFLQKSLEYHSDGSPKQVKLILTDEFGSQFICYLPHGMIDKSNDELVKAGADDIYNRFFPKRAENERFTSIEDWLRNAEQDRNTRFRAMELKVDEAIAELTNLIVGLVSFDIPSETEEGLRE
ncbi:TPA: DUF1366 domain-containing protein [Streptococcus suis]